MKTLTNNQKATELLINVEELLINVDMLNMDTLGTTIKDVKIFDPHYNASFVGDIHVISDNDNEPLAIGVDRNAQLKEVILDDNGIVTLDNSNSFGSIDYINHTVEGWCWDRDGFTPPVNFKSTGRYAEHV